LPAKELRPEFSTPQHKSVQEAPNPPSRDARLDHLNH